MSKIILNKFIFIFLMLSLNASLSAQIEQGAISILPEFNLIINKNSFSDDTESSFNLILSPGIFFAKNIAINADLGFSTFRDSNGTAASQNTSILIGARLVFMIPVSERFYIPAFVGYGYNFNSFSSTSGFNFSPDNTENVFFGVGVEYLVADRLGLRFSLLNRFSFVKNDDLIQSEVSGFIGVNLYFAKQSK